jgi:hypothetical protein
MGTKSQGRGVTSRFSKDSQEPWCWSRVSRDVPVESWDGRVWRRDAVWPALCLLCREQTEGDKGGRQKTSWGKTSHLNQVGVPGGGGVGKMLNPRSALMVRLRDSLRVWKRRVNLSPRFGPERWEASIAIKSSWCKQELRSPLLQRLSLKWLLDIQVERASKELDTQV